MNADNKGVEVLDITLMQEYVRELADIDHCLVKLSDAAYSNELWGIVNFLSEQPRKWEFSRIYVANGQAWGAIIVSAYHDYFLHIHRFFVKPDHQNQRIGRALNDSLIIGAKQKGMKMITLFVNSENRKAIRFYEENGYKKLEGDALAEVMWLKGKSHFLRDCFFDEHNVRYQAYHFKL